MILKGKNDGEGRRVMDLVLIYVYLESNSRMYAS